MKKKQLQQYNKARELAKKAPAIRRAYTKEMANGGLVERQVRRCRVRRL